MPEAEKNANENHRPSLKGLLNFVANHETARRITRALAGNAGKC